MSRQLSTGVLGRRKKGDDESDRLKLFMQDLGLYNDLSLWGFNTKYDNIIEVDVIELPTTGWSSSGLGANVFFLPNHSLHNHIKNGDIDYVSTGNYVSVTSGAVNNLTATYVVVNETEGINNISSFETYLSSNQITLINLGIKKVKSLTDLSNNNNPFTQFENNKAPAIFKKDINFGEIHRMQSDYLAPSNGVISYMFWCYNREEFGVTGNFLSGLHDTVNAARLHLGNITGGVRYAIGNSFFTDGVFPNNEYAHIAMCGNGSIAHCYVNGVRISPVSGRSYSFGNTNIGFPLGARLSTSLVYDQPMLGTMNDIRLFEKNLTETEIQQIFNHSKSYYGL